ncbi:MAG TPA: S9 family peptidase [Candidatus Eisenbacteria bacterium]|jgi:dipeptidyl aminopeptidase/acylaminoacyl peptidase
MPLPLWTLLVTTTGAAAPAARPIESRSRPEVQRYSIEQLFATRAIGGADWSPDGARVAFVSNISGRNNLWLVSARGGWPTQLTVSDERQGSPAWSPDGRRIAFMSDHEADEQWDLFVADPRSGEVWNLTKTDTISEEGPLWSPDGRLLAHAVKPQHAPNYEIALYDLETRASRPLTRGTPADWSLTPVAFVPGGRWLLAARTHASDKDADAVLVDLESGELRVLTPHRGEQRWVPSDVSPDGARVLLTSNARNGFDNVALLPLDTAERPRETWASTVCWVTEERWEASAGTFSPDGRTLLYHVNADGEGELFAFEPASGRRQRLALGGGWCEPAGARTSFSPDGARLLCRRSAADSPGDLLVCARDGSGVTPITQSFVGGVDPGDMVEPILVHYPSRDRMQISAFLYLPWNLKKDGANAALVWPHGGPTAQSVNGFNRAVQFFVNQGYVVLCPNYRGSTGYGTGFKDANRFDMGGGDLADVVAGAEFLKGTGYVDARKIAVGGGSYGGYLTMAAVTKAPDAWAAGVAMFPFVNWFTEVEHEDPLLRQYDLATMGDPKKNEALWRDRSPIFFVDRIRCPLMLVAGAHDPRCPPDEARQVRDALAKRGVPCEYLLYDDEGHGFARRENLFDAYRKIAAFLARTLGPGGAAAKE